MKGDLVSRHSIRINVQYRIVFRWVTCEILLHDFLEPMKRTQLDFSKHLGWTYARVNEIVNGKRGVPEEEALCFSDAFGNSAQFWHNLQANHDLWNAQQEYKKIKPLKSAAS